MHVMPIFPRAERPTYACSLALNSPVLESLTFTEKYCAMEPAAERQLIVFDFDW